MRTVEHINRELNAAEKQSDSWQERVKRLRDERDNALAKLNEECILV